MAKKKTEIFRVLPQFFRHSRRSVAEPTAKELERDMHKGKAMIKESAEAEIDE